MSPDNSAFGEVISALGIDSGRITGTRKQSTRSKDT
jgi:hypothetical protein